MRRSDEREDYGPILAVFLAGVVVVGAPWAGAAVRGGWDNAFELIGAMLLAALAWTSPRLLARCSRTERVLVLSVLGLLGVGALQLIPLGPLEAVLSPGTSGLRDLAGKGSSSATTASVYPHATRAALATLVVAAAVATATARAPSLRSLRGLAIVFVLSATAQAALAVIQPLQADPFVFWPDLQRGSLVRGQGTFGSPNHLAASCALALPLALALALAPARDRRWRTLWLLPACVLVAGIVASGSRSGALAAVAAAVTFAFLAERGQRLNAPRLAGLSMVAVAIAVGISPLVERFRGIDQELPRLRFWAGALQIFRDAPVLGSGLGTYAQVAPIHVESELLPNAAHNDYLNLLSDAGLIGAALGAAALIAFLLALRQHARRLQSGRRRVFFAACAGSAAAVLVASGMEFNLQIPANLWAFAGLCGAALGVGRLASSAKASGSPAAWAWRSKALAAALVLASILLTLTGTRLGVAARLELKARDVTGEARRAALAAAERFAPERGDLLALRAGSLVEGVAEAQSLAGGLRIAAARVEEQALAHAESGGRAAEVSLLRARARELRRDADQQLEHADAEAREATRLLALAIEREPLRARHHLALAHSLLLVRRFEASEEELRAVERLAPHFPGLRLHAAQLRLVRLTLPPAPADHAALQERARSGLRRVAQSSELRAEAFDTALAYLPHEELHTWLGDQGHALADHLALRGRFGEAAGILAPAARKADADPALVLRWAELEAEGGNVDLAATAYRRAALRGSAEQRARALRAARLVLLGDRRSDAAVVLVRELTERYPEEGALWVEQGLVLLTARAPDAAVAALERAVDLKAAGARGHLARAYGAAGRPRSQREALRAAVREARNAKEQARLYERLARVLEAEGKRDEAMDALERAIQAQPSEALEAELDRLVRDQ